MKFLTALFAPLTIFSSAAWAEQPNVTGRRLSPEDVRMIAPALEKFTQDDLYGDVWKRPELSRRDRSIITLSVFIARGQAAPLNYYIGQALDNGVKPTEISEIITHLAFYSGWANAFAAVGPTKEVFVQRGLKVDPDMGTKLPLNEKSEATRKATVEKNIGSVAPQLAEDTTNLLFRDLWLRPGLAPRDRSLVTVSALAATGQFEQITFHLNRAMDNGLTEKEVGGLLSHLAFYAGWPNAMSATAVAKKVIEERHKAAEEIKSTTKNR